MLEAPRELLALARPSPPSAPPKALPPDEGETERLPIEPPPLPRPMSEAPGPPPPRSIVDALGPPRPPDEPGPPPRSIVDALGPPRPPDAPGPPRSIVDALGPPRLFPPYLFAVARSP